MIGIASLWPKALFLLVAFGLMAGVYHEWREVFRKKTPFTLKLVGITAFVAIWTLLILQSFVRESVFHYELSQLRPESVESIDIGKNVITDASARSSIVHALNHAQWFAVNHGGWGEEIPLVIHLKSGGHQTYHVAQYFRESGAVLLSKSNYDSPGAGVSWYKGVAFCPDLPAVLNSSGASLPGMKLPSPVPVVQAREGPSSKWPAKLLPLVILGFFTLVALMAFYDIAFGKTDWKKQSGQAFVQRGWIGKAIGLPIVAVVAAWASLRVVNVLFDWPDPTNKTLIIAVTLVLLAIATAVLNFRFRRSGSHTS